MAYYFCLNHALRRRKKLRHYRLHPRVFLYIVIMKGYVAIFFCMVRLCLLRFLFVLEAHEYRYIIAQKLLKNMQA